MYSAQYTAPAHTKRLQYVLKIAFLQMKYILFVGENAAEYRRYKMRQAIWNKNQTLYAVLARTGFAQKPGKRGSVIFRI